MRIWTQKSASMHLRTSLPKFDQPALLPSPPGSLKQPCGLFRRDGRVHRAPGVFDRFLHPLLRLHQRIVRLCRTNEIRVLYLCSAVDEMHQRDFSRQVRQYRSFRQHWSQPWQGGTSALARTASRFSKKKRMYALRLFFSLGTFRNFPA